jgi:hypothetical protein
MAQTSMQGRLWHLWKRGVDEGLVAFAAAGGGFSVGMLFMLKPSWWYFPALMAYFGTVLIGRTFAVAWARVDPASVREDVAARLSPDVDALLTHLGLSWEDSPVHEVGRLLQEGRLREARRLYRSAVGVTWDEADKALASWPAAVVEAKVKLIREHLAPSHHPAEAVGAGVAAG